MSRKKPPAGPGGLIIVDKPAGMTSHDVVSRVRRIAGTRRVGHAGTLDPMATGVLVLGVERSTKLLNYLSLTDKAYLATIRLGTATTTDDREGETVFEADPDQLDAITDAAIEDAMTGLRGEIEQRPASVSAIKVAGRRAYDRVRDGEDVELAARPVTVSRFEVCGPLRRSPRALDLDVVVECSSGTYVRALARDLGAALGVGGHLTSLRRTRVGPFTLEQSAALESLAEQPDPISLPLPRAIAAAMPVRSLTSDEAVELSFGRSIAAAGIGGVYGGLDVAGTAVALLVEDGDRARPVLGFTPAG